MGQKVKVQILQTPYYSRRGLGAMHRAGQTVELSLKEAFELVKADVAQFADPELQAKFVTGRLNLAADVSRERTIAPSVDASEPTLSKDEAPERPTRVKVERGKKRPKK